MSWLAIKGSPRWLKKGRPGRRRRLRGARGRGTLEKEKPPILGMLQRGGEVVIHLLENVQQATIKPLIRATISAGSHVHTDEYDIYARLREWGRGSNYAPLRGNERMILLLWAILEMREWQRQWQSGNAITAPVAGRVVVTGG